MKVLQSLIVVLTCPFLLQAQLEIQAEHQLLPNDNIERYGLDYELINYTFVNGDSTILNSIYLDRALQLRLEFLDRELNDINNNLTILLYSEKRAREARGLSPIFDPTKKQKL